jgi:hypothetical protein
MNSFRRFPHEYGRARYFLMVLVICLSAYADPVFAGAASPPPAWSTGDRLTSDDGYAELTWQSAGDGQVELYRLTESRDGQELHGYVSGRRLLLYRVVPGSYSFWLQSCTRDTDGIPVCGRKSKRLTLDVSEAILGEFDGAAGGSAGSTAATRADAVPGGPDQLRPGLWFNPARHGHGFSFFWANRLALPETNALHGIGYDLHGIWYTYEAKSVTLSGSVTCDFENSPGDCTWTYSDYRPLAARLRLVRDGANSYSGGIYIVRNGAEVMVGSASLLFSAGNTLASLDWSADFRHQRLSDRDDLEFLAGSNPAETVNATHYSGIWEPVYGGQIQFVDNIGSYSEAAEILFVDANGDPTWIQAVNEGIATPAETPLCFYYVESGYAPDSTGIISLHESACDSGVPATPINHNGTRRFSDFRFRLFRSGPFKKYLLGRKLNRVSKKLKGVSVDIFLPDNMFKLFSGLKDRSEALGAHTPI